MPEGQVYTYIHMYVIVDKPLSEIRFLCLPCVMIMMRPTFSSFWIFAWVTMNF